MYCVAHSTAIRPKARSSVNVVTDIESDFGEAGLGDAELVQAAPVSATFGDTVAVFLIRPLPVRFVRDRGEVFIDPASQSAPDIFHQVDDIGIA